MSRHIEPIIKGPTILLGLPGEQTQQIAAVLTHHNIKSDGVTDDTVAIQKVLDKQRTREQLRRTRFDYKGNKGIRNKYY